MPRNAQGVYTLPAGNPVVAGTLIETTWANPTMSDIAAALTGSLPRDGSAPMTGPLILSRDAVLPLEATTLQQVNTALGASSNYMPAGAIQLFAMSAIPTGWLECNGAAVSRTTYANLFAVIGTTYGAGDGSITFNLPDMRGQFARGWDHERGVDPGRALGSTQAPANQNHTHTPTVTNPTHYHGIADPGHAHTITDPGHLHGGSVGHALGDGLQFGPGAVAGTIDPNTTGISINAQGTGISIAGASQGTTVTIGQQGTEARPTNVALVYCIRAFGALQTDGLGSMAFQNKDAVDITGGTGVFTTLQCTTTPTQPNDVARLADIGTGLSDIFSSDPQVLLVDKTNAQDPILRPQVNVPNGTVKLDALGFVPSSVLNITDLTFLGAFSALAGTLPVGTFVTGDYYQIDVAGTLTLNTSSGEVATVCNVGDQIIYQATTPGWWYSPASVAATLPASSITFVPAGTIAATNVQSALQELDSETQTALAGKAPSSAATAVGTSFTPAGTIAATDVQAAIAELDSETQTALAGKAPLSATVPAGAVMDFAMTIIPAGWLACNGAAVSRTTYADLYAAIGTTWGVGDGSTTFNVPDARGRYRACQGTDGAAASKTFGQKLGDAIRNITGACGTVYRAAAQGNSGALSMVAFGSTPAKPGVSGTDSGDNANIDFNASLQVPTASENRPYSIVVQTCIKT